MTLIFRSIQTKLLALLALPALLLSACVQDGETIEGTLRAIDCIDGQITVVTDEGRTFLMTIETPDCEAEDLSEGQKVRVETDEDVRVVHQVTVIEQQTVVQETTVVGKIVNVQADRVIVRKDTGEEVTVRVEPDKTKVEANGEAEPAVQHLRQDVTVVINIDQQTNVAQTIKIENGAEAPESEATPTPEPGPSPTPEPEATPTPEPEASPTSEVTTVRGVITSVSASTVSIQTEDGQDITLHLVSETKIESSLETEATLSEGDEVTVEFDAQSQAAVEIEILAHNGGSDS